MSASRCASLKFELVQFQGITRLVDKAGTERNERMKTMQKKKENNNKQRLELKAEQTWKDWNLQGKCFKSARL